MMPRLRPYFLLGDILANVITGMLAAVACSALVGPGWHMLPAMLVCMMIGMVLALIVGLGLFARYFGAMEVMVPTMLTGMLAGMTVGMVAAISTIAWPLALGLGTATGLFALVITYIANACLAGRIVS